MPASPALDSRSPVSERVAVVIPTLNEAESIAAVIAALPRHLVDQIIVADGGSTDGTPQIARGAGNSPRPQQDTGVQHLSKTA